jgi:uncharacterized protein (TIGR00251 family)
LSEAPSPFTHTDAGILVAVRLSPKSSRARLDGVELDAAGKAWLKVRVTAPPEKGKANAALLKQLAKSWGLPVRRLAIRAGARDRRKLVLIEGGDSELARELATAL